MQRQNVGKNCEMALIRRLLLFSLAVLCITFVLFVQLLSLIIYERNDADLLVYPSHSNRYQSQFLSSLVIVKGVGSYEFNDNHTTTRLPRATTARPIADRYESEQTCQFPILDPFDKSLLPYVEHPKPLQCRKVQPYLTFVRANTMHVDRKACEKYKVNKLKMR